MESINTPLYSRSGAAKAPGTFANHTSTVGTYVAFMARSARDPMNPTTQVFCAFLEYLASHTQAPATIRNKVSHVRVFLRLAGYTTALLDHTRVKMALDAFERDKTYVPRVKDPLLVDDMVRALACLWDTVIRRAVMAAILVIYYGALRQSEIAPMTMRTFDPSRHPTRGDLQVMGTLAKLHIKWAKNLQKVGQFKVVTLPILPDSPLCPVAAIEANIMEVPTVCDTDPLLMFPDTRQPIPVSLIKARWEAALVKAGLDTKKLSLHSLRKTSATQAHSKGCSETEIKRLGGWRSKAYQTYIATQTGRVTKALVDTMPI